MFSFTYCFTISRIIYLDNRYRIFQTIKGLYIKKDVIWLIIKLTVLVILLNTWWLWAATVHEDYLLYKYHHYVRRQFRDVVIFYIQKEIFLMCSAKYDYIIKILKLRL